MLSKLSITNYILIQNLTINFDKGLNIITGETGAGKSIILSAVAFVLGSRADKNLIRDGEQFARVEIQFDCLDDKTKNLLNDFGIDADETLVLSRKLYLDGKNDIRANGQIVTVGMLKQITVHLLEIYGQHSYQILLDENKHIDLVDIMLGDALDEPLNNLNTLLKTKQAITADLAKYNIDDASREREKQMLEYQINEIKEAALSLGEDNELYEQLLMMKNTQKVVENLNMTNAIINSNDAVNVLNMLYNAQHGLSTLVDIDKDIGTLYNRIESTRLELEDIAQTSEKIISKYDFSEQDYIKVDKRLDRINDLKRKYGATIEEILDFDQKAEERLNILTNSQQYINEQKQKLQFLESQLENVCEKISELRKKESSILSEKLISELKTLGIKNAQFEIRFESSNISAKGRDKLSFWFSANMGQKIMPLSKVMSGGEMSRFMLAFDIVFGKNKFGTLIFDEIDSGISGEVSHAVGLKLYQLSKESQIIAITHLPAICAMADVNFKVEKNIVNNNTTTIVTRLENLTNITEIARLTGVIGKSQIALQNAQELKNICNQQKTKIMAG